MKFHKNLIQAIVASVDQIFNQNIYADKLIERTLKSNPKWGSRDRKIVAETIYELVRWKRLYLTILGDDTASIKNIWLLTGIHFILKKTTLPYWDEFSTLNKEEILLRNNNLQNQRKIRESIPDWLDEIGEKELGDEWDSEIAALNQQAKVVLRVNELKINRDELTNLFAQEAVEVIPHQEVKSALILKERKNVFKSELFKSGFFEIQDVSSQLVAPFLQLEPGMRVIDACAGAGGKSLHIATILQNKGKVIALDTEKWKLDELQKRAKRNNIQNIEVKMIESSKTIKRLKESADRLLLDVPCSGLGVLRRNPDAKWKMSIERINELKIVQQQILTNYQSMLKPGGMMVYSTCSILPSENQQQIEKFLLGNNNFSLIEEKIISPSKSGFDGFYIAVLKKS
ncbi:MAG: methyltransferase domain-containing protein [Ignavibacteria bacterium]|nr:methyltransferase domain-containing protein [Ignavibacteria bacterium]